MYNCVSRSVTGECVRTWFLEIWQYWSHAFLLKCGAGWLRTGSVKRRLGWLLLKKFNLQQLAGFECGSQLWTVSACNFGQNDLVEFDRFPARGMVGGTGLEVVFTVHM
jgi:hypothetical protein